jgi:hypothetical protein
MFLDKGTLGQQLLTYSHDNGRKYTEVYIAISFYPSYIKELIVRDIVRDQ